MNRPFPGYEPAPTGNLIVSAHDRHLRELAMKEAFNADIESTHALDSIRVAEGLTEDDMQRGTMGYQWKLDEIRRAEQQIAGSRHIQRVHRQAAKDGSGLGRFSGLQSGALMKQKPAPFIWSGPLIVGASVAIIVALVALFGG